MKEAARSSVFTRRHDVTLDKPVGFFITMNPGYAGRQELPENLKSLFRGVTMMVPDRQIIMKVKLAACGYNDNELLAQEVLRALRAVRGAALEADALRLRPAQHPLGAAHLRPSKRDNLDAAGELLLMRTLRDMNLSKFVGEDVPLFLSLIGDLFPGAQGRHEDATPSCRRTSEGGLITSLGLQCTPRWVGKVIQLYESDLVRHGIMLVGPSGGGKTRILELQALRAALDHRRTRSTTASRA